MTNLTIATQAVLQAACIHHGLFNEEIVQHRRSIAAVLRVVAGQLKNTHVVGDCDEFERGFKEAHILYRSQLLDIAKELEAQ